MRNKSLHEMSFSKRQNDDVLGRRNDVKPKHKRRIMEKKHFNIKQSKMYPVIMSVGIVHNINSRLGRFRCAKIGT